MVGWGREEWRLLLPDSVWVLFFSPWAWTGVVLISFPLSIAVKKIPKISNLKRAKVSFGLWFQNLQTGQLTIVWAYDETESTRVGSLCYSTAALCSNNTVVWNLPG